MGTRVVYIGATADEAGQLSNEVGRIGVSIDLGPLSQIIIFYLSNLILLTQFYIEFIPLLYSFGLFHAQSVGNAHLRSGSRFCACYKHCE